MLLGTLRSPFAAYFTVKFGSMGFGSFLSAFPSRLSHSHLTFPFAFAQKMSPPENMHRRFASDLLAFSFFYLLTRHLKLCGCPSTVTWKKIFTSKHNDKAAIST
jgi:hypothetical protein